MIRVKNGGMASVVTGGTIHNPITSEVFEGIVKPNYIGKGRASYDILFKGKTAGWYAPRTVTPAVKAVVANPEKNIEAVEAKPAVMDICPLHEFSNYGYYPFGEFECGPFEADAEDKNLTALCEAQAVKVLGDNWEILDLEKTV